jgi:hypothetical protein
MSNRPLTRNITSTFRAATDMDRAVGYGWYARARDLAVEIAHFQLLESKGRDYPVDDFEREVQRAAGVIAALSPRLAWRKNVEYAKLAYMVHGTMQNDAIVWPDGTREAYFTGMIPTLNANARKAFRILNGEDPEDVLGGPKVRAFYFTIVNPTDPRAVVVDRHAIDITFGQVLDDQARGLALGRKGAYDTVAELYRRAARIVSAELGEIWTPAQVQATTWTYWRRERAAAYHGEA